MSEHGHKIKIVVTDSKNNTSILNFSVQGPTQPQEQKHYHAPKNGGKD